MSLYETIRDKNWRPGDVPCSAWALIKGLCEEVEVLQARVQKLEQTPDPRHDLNYRTSSERPNY